MGTHFVLCSVSLAMAREKERKERLGSFDFVRQSLRQITSNELPNDAVSQLTLCFHFSEYHMGK